MSCAVALAVLNVIDKEKLRVNAVMVGRYLVEKLNKLKESHPIIGDVR